MNANARFTTFLLSVPEGFKDAEGYPLKAQDEVDSLLIARKASADQRQVFSNMRWIELKEPKTAD